MIPLKPDAVSRPRLIFVTLHQNRFTMKSLVEPLSERGVQMDIVGWEEIWASDSLPRATWILTDFDRLAPGELDVAARLYRALGAAGCRVLNDPVHFLPRAAYLRRLHAVGLNRFTCWLPALGEMPDRFPCFLRTAAAHRGVMTDLLRDADAARAALDAALDAGNPLSDLVFVEFAAEHAPGYDFYRKKAAHRAGPAIVCATDVNDRNWMAKRGEFGLTPPADFAAQLAEAQLADYPFAAFARRAFDLCGLEFGRVDFGIVAGRPQVYEVNSNPMVHPPKQHPNADRVETMRLVFDNLVAALADLAGPSGEPVDISTLFRRHVVALPDGQEIRTLRKD